MGPKRSDGDSLASLHQLSETANSFVMKNGYKMLKMVSLLFKTEHQPYLSRLNSEQTDEFCSK